MHRHMSKLTAVSGGNQIGRASVSVLHITEKKGWQCEERHEPPPPKSEMPQDCRKDKSTPLCFCREAHLYWNALAKGTAAVDEAMAKAKANNGVTMMRPMT